MKCLCGFDGFVDEVVHTVDRRLDAENYDRIRTLDEYGKRISGASNLSMNIEIVTINKKLGGNGPIFALALKRYGADVKYIGAVGKDLIHPVFSELADGSEMYGIVDPAQTDAMEFEDGKIIRSKLSSFNDLDWNAIKAKVGLENFAAMMDDADMISFNNWTMILYMSDIWEGIISEAVPLMKTGNKHDKVLFFDLADPEKRKPEDIKKALRYITGFYECGFNTVLGLNKKEACEIAVLFGAEIDDFRSYPLEKLCNEVYAAVPIDCVVIHPVDCAAAISKDSYTCVKGPFCENPKLTTGASDNFNAGFIIGYCGDKSREDSLKLGVCTSGYYVREAHSPDRAEIEEFMRRV